MSEKKQNEIKLNFKQMAGTLWKRKKLILTVWVVTFVLSVLYIFPEPRYYVTKVSVVPESAEPKGGSDLMSLASSFGVNIGGGFSDAIYPQLYPDLFKSTSFLVDLLEIPITTKDGQLSTDYYTYLDKHQKDHVLFHPWHVFKKWLGEKLAKKEEPVAPANGKRFDPFRLSRQDSKILETMIDKVKCKYSKTTDVVTITVEDQDPLVSAVLADSIKAHLQTFITDYRTKKSRVDYEHYKQLTAEAKHNYEKARQRYAAYADANDNAYLQSVKSVIEDMENEMQLRYNIYTAMNTRLEAAMAKVQENTPVFTTLTNSTVPVKPAGPKRVIFVAAMLMLATIGVVIHIFRKELKEWF